MFSQCYFFYFCIYFKCFELLVSFFQTFLIIVVVVGAAAAIVVARLTAITRPVMGTIFLVIHNSSSKTD